jgi:phage shock protein E|tara:strand:+ start:167 stop:493 length:327 start_codon:yes stop_codon:yes gene_type:complete
MKKILLFILILIVQQDLLATESLIIDVRTDNEWNNGYIENAKHIPISELKKRLSEIQAFKDQPVFTYCAAGKRAERAKNLLIENGFTNVTNLGGIQDASTKLDKDIVE